MANVQEVKDIVKTQRVLTVYDFFNSQKEIISKALGRIMDADRMVALFTMMFKSSPEIANCSPVSLIAAVVQTIQVGLTPGAINHVYFVPFNNRKKDGSVVKECQLIIGYKGLMELVNRSGQASILSTECVYENDDFDYAFGLEPKLVHKPKKGDRGVIIGVYCVAKNLLAQEKLFVYLTKAEIDKVRGASRAGQIDYSPWNKWYEEMAKKTAIKRIVKLLPLSIDTQRKLSADETIKTEIAPEMIEVKDVTEWNDAPEPSPEPSKEVK